MNIAHVFGIDPGLVHTGVVRLTFKPYLRTVDVTDHLVQGPDAQAVDDWLAQTTGKHHVFVEKYTPRLSLDSDVRMVQAEQDLRRTIPNAVFLRNTGIKRVIPQSLMEVLGVWSFRTSTHHQDLRSAARIALLGMVKDPPLNQILADVVRDHLDGNQWTVAHV